MGFRKHGVGVIDDPSKIYPKGWRAGQRRINFYMPVELEERLAQFQHDTRQWSRARVICELLDYALSQPEIYDLKEKLADHMTSNALADQPIKWWLEDPQEKIT